MKNLILLLFCLFTLSEIAIANESFLVRGSLIDDINLNGRINKMVFTENKTEIKLQNEYLETESCHSGSFTIIKNTDGFYQLDSVVSCDSWVDEPSQVEACPEIYRPVCGELNFPDFKKALPQIITFPNACEFYRAKATFIKAEQC